MHEVLKLTKVSQYNSILFQLIMNINKILEQCQSYNVLGILNLLLLTMCIKKE